MGRLIDGNLPRRGHHVRSASSGPVLFFQRDAAYPWRLASVALNADDAGPVSAGPLECPPVAWEADAPDVAASGRLPPAGKGVLGSSLRTLARRSTVGGSSAGRTAQTRSAGAATSVLGCFPFSTDVARYQVGEIMGYGASAKVHLAKYTPSPGASESAAVAIKAINTDMYARKEIESLRKEIQIMSLSRHPNVLPVHAAFMPPNSHDLWIVTPLMSAGSCSDILSWKWNQGMPEIAVREILLQAMRGLEYLHFFNLVHRDIKAANILVDQSSGVVKLADFGISSSLVDSASGSRVRARNSFVGTPCWMAPEVVQQEDYDFKADIWSFGITAIEVLTGRAPYATLPPVKVFMMTLQAEPPNLEDWEVGPNAVSSTSGGDIPTIPRVFSKAARDLVRACLQKDPADRPDCARLLKSHPFFKQKGGIGRFRNAQYSSSSTTGTFPPGCARIVDILCLAEMAPVEQRAKQRKGKAEVVVAMPTWDFGDDQNRATVEGDAGQSTSGPSPTCSGRAERPTKTAHFSATDSAHAAPDSLPEPNETKKAGRFTVFREADDGAAAPIFPPASDFASATPPACNEGAAFAQAPERNGHEGGTRKGRFIVQAPDCRLSG